MMKNNCCSAAMMCGHNGAVWATSPGFGLQAHTVQQMQEDGSTVPLNVNEPVLIKEAAGGTMTSQCGLYINRVKYLVVNYNPANNCTYIKSKSGGGCMVKTNQCILIGIFTTSNSNPNMNAGGCNRDVEDLAEKLKAVGY